MYQPGKIKIGVHEVTINRVSCWRQQVAGASAFRASLKDAFRSRRLSYVQSVDRQVPNRPPRSQVLVLWKFPCDRPGTSIASCVPGELKRASGDQVSSLGWIWSAKI